MVFKDNFVVVVVVNGQILREHDGAVILPFGSDYSLKLKNMEARRAVVSVSIDGQDVLGGSRLVMNGNSETVLEGFLEGNIVRNAFRFIRKDAEVVKHRGDKIDDGIVRVEYRFEKRKPEHIHIDKIYYYPYPYWPPYTITYTSDNTRRTGLYQVYGCVRGTDSPAKNSYSNDNVSYSYNPGNFRNFATPMEDEGITVKGADRSQHFSHAHVSALEENAHVITLKLRGVKGNGTDVVKPVLTKDRIECPTCGRKWKSYVRYCGHCATRLI